MASNTSTARPGAELDLADRLGHEMIRFVRLISKAKSQVSGGPDGIERAAYAMLFYLIHEGPQRTSKLAEFLHSEISTISRQSSSLVQHGLVERQPDPEDGRACLLAPTTEGMRVFEENRKLRNQWLAELMGDWSADDRETFHRLFARLNGAIEHSPQFADVTPAAKAKEALTQ